MADGVKVEMFLSTLICVHITRLNGQRLRRVVRQELDELS